MEIPSIFIRLDLVLRLPLLIVPDAVEPCKWALCELSIEEMEDKDSLGRDDIGWIAAVDSKFCAKRTDLLVVVDEAQQLGVFDPLPSTTDDPSVAAS